MKLKGKESLCVATDELVIAFCLLLICKNRGHLGCLLC